MIEADTETLEVQQLENSSARDGVSVEEVGAPNGQNELRLFEEAEVALAEEKQEPSETAFDTTLRVLPNRRVPAHPLNECWHRTGTASLGKDIAQPIKVQDDVACQQRCRENKDCYHSMFDTPTKKCHLKGSEMLIYLKDKQMMGPKSCDISCLKKGVAYNGAPDVSEPFQTELATDCTMRCSVLPGCKAFYWVEEENLCYFKGQPGFTKFKTVGTFPKAIAGPNRFCDEGGNLDEIEAADIQASL